MIFIFDDVRCAEFRYCGILVQLRGRQSLPLWRYVPSQQLSIYQRITVKGETRIGKLFHRSGLYRNGRMSKNGGFIGDFPFSAISSGILPLPAGSIPKNTRLGVVGYKPRARQIQVPDFFGRHCFSVKTIFCFSGQGWLPRRITRRRSAQMCRSSSRLRVGKDGFEPPKA